jgi:2-dehydro-3-deoxyphosphogluconate aldolase/(4S)-4-hydroxy-2-oxoglutarate aldolase
MGKLETLSIIRECGVIAILRARSSERLMAVVDAIRRGGIAAVEVTMTTPGALEVIAEVKARYGQSVVFGAGSVLDSDSGRAAILAGADFIVSPTLNLELIRTCNRYAVPVMPGSLPPTEILAGWEAGADLVKLFPASIGGPALVNAIRAPLPQVELVPVGGVTLETTAEFIRNGAAAVGVGSSLVDQKALDAGDLEHLTRQAASFVAEVKKGRGL